MTDVDPIRSLAWKCSGRIRNNGGDTLQARTTIGFSGALKLVVDGMYLRPDETCTPDEGWESPTQIDGWPGDWVFGLPAGTAAAAQALAPERLVALSLDLRRGRGA